MRLRNLTIGGLFLMMIISSLGVTAPPPNYQTIQSGNILYSDDVTVITTGFDEYGYNYQAHMFCGSYFNVYARDDGYPPYEGDDTAYLDENPSAESYWAWSTREIFILMEWNDAWLSNKDYDFDNHLDTHPGYDNYIGTGAWITHYMDGTFEMDGETCQWNYYVKIVAAPADAYIDSDVWYYADGSEMGPVTWNEFAMVQSILNDPCEGYLGIEYLGAHPGFGYN